MKKTKLLIPLISAATIGGVLLPAVSCSQGEPEPQPVTKYSVLLDLGSSKGIQKIEGPESVEEKKALEFTFVLQDFYVTLNKEDINIKIGSNRYTDFTFDSAAKKVIIAEGVITGNVVVSANAHQEAVGGIYGINCTSELNLIESDTDEFYEEMLVAGSRVSFWLEEKAETKNKMIVLGLDGETIEKDAVQLDVGGKEIDLTYEKDYEINVSVEKFTLILTTAGATRIKALVEQPHEYIDIYVNFYEIASAIKTTYFNSQIGYEYLPDLVTKLYVDDELYDEDTIPLEIAFEKGFKVKYYAPSKLVGQYTNFYPYTYSSEATVAVGSYDSETTLDKSDFDFSTGHDEDGTYFSQFVFHPGVVYDNLFPWIDYYQNLSPSSEYTFTATDTGEAQDPTIDKTSVDILFDESKTFVITLKEASGWKYVDSSLQKISIGDFILLPEDPSNGETNYTSIITNKTITITFTEHGYEQFIGHSTNVVSVAVEAQEDI